MLLLSRLVKTGDIFQDEERMGLARVYHGFTTGLGGGEEGRKTEDGGRKEGKKVKRLKD